jgi:hypothetical protein
MFMLQEWREREQDQEETCNLLQLRMIFSAISFGFCGGTHSFEDIGMTFKPEAS